MTAHTVQLQCVTSTRAGGFYVETFRGGAKPGASVGVTDPGGATVHVPGRTGGVRNDITSIYYMLTAKEPIGALFVNKSPHVHNHHRGAPLRYHIVGVDGTYRTEVLGPNLQRGERPQVIVLGGELKAAEILLTQPQAHAQQTHKHSKHMHSLGADYVLLGESVGPGWDVRDFAEVDEETLRQRLQLAGDSGWQEHFELLRQFIKTNPCTTEMRLGLKRP